MPTVKLLRGEPITVHKNAPVDVVPGQIVIFEQVPLIAINRAKAGNMAAFAAGGGVYATEGSDVGHTLFAGDRALVSTTKFITKNGSGAPEGDYFDLGFWVNVSAGYGDFVHNPHASDMMTI